jgi:hypothetical protein
MDKNRHLTNKGTPTATTPAPPTKTVTTEPNDRVALEATSYLRGLFQEFHQQKHRYAALTSELLSMEARIELAEKTLCLTRDHLAMAIARADSAVPTDWTEVLARVRFVGMRLADACMTLLAEHKKMTPKEILYGLNVGMFRFRTSSPLREIHAALLRQNSVKKIGSDWVWAGTADQLPMRFRVLKRELIEAAPTSSASVEVAKEVEQSKP